MVQWGAARPRARTAHAGLLALGRLALGGLLLVASCDASPPRSASGAGGAGGGSFVSTTGAAGLGGACPETSAGGAATGGAGGAVPVDPACDGALVGIRYASDVAPIFAGCTGELCHEAPTRATTVEVASRECCDGSVLVSPGSPSRSFLVDKLHGDRLCGGAAMPFDAPAIAPAKLATIVGWICAGAADD